MTAMTTDVLIEKLKAAVEEMGAEDVLEIYNQIFQDEPASEEDAYEDVSALSEQIADHLDSGLGREELVDLWKLAFPKDRDVSFDEDEEEDDGDRADDDVES